MILFKQIQCRQDSISATDCQPTGVNYQVISLIHAALEIIAHLRTLSISYYYFHEIN